MNTLNYPYTPGFKTDQPETSINAAKKETSRAATLREQCYEVLEHARKVGINGHTADEVARYLGKTEFSIRPRLSELSKLLRIVDSGIRRKNQSGHNAVVWKIPSTKLEQINLV